MGISMYLGSSQSQASSTKATLSRQIEGYTSLQKALNDFVYNSADLSGHAYDSAKAYISTVLIPLTRACILLNEAIAQATADFPSRYVAEVDSTSLHEDQLVDLIAKADQTIVRYRKLWNLEYASDRPNYSLLNSLDRQIDIQQELKRKLQEKLDKLRAFHASSPQIFSAIGSLAQAVNQGMRQAKMSWNSGTQTFDIPNRGDLAWTKAINQQWLDRKVSKTSFRDQVDSLSLAELEKKYNGVLNTSNAYVGAGYDGRYAGLKVSPEEADYIRSRHALLKAQGQMSLKETEHLDTMFANLSLKDKVEIDAMSLHDITNLNISVLLPRKGLELGYAFVDKEEKARIDYLYHRFEQLMAKEPIDWRDPQFMEKLNAHINETGLNPFTGKPATEHEKFVAKHYGWVKSSATTIATISAGVSDWSDLMVDVARGRLGRMINEVPTHNLTVEQQKQISSVQKGSRLSPEFYFSKGYLRDHEQLFGNGVARISKSDYFLKKTGYMGIVDTDILNGLPAKEYVFPVEYLDTIVQSSGGDITYLERNLGLEIGSLGENPVIMKVKQGNYSGLSIPSGNEFGANDQWIPGGKLPTGIPEAVIDPVSIEKVEIKEWSNYVKEQLKPY